MTQKIWIYTDHNKPEGDADRLKVFATEDVANEWFKVHDPEGVAFAYPVIETKKAAPPPKE